MMISDLAGKSVCILGFGREGHAMLKALEEHAPGCDVTIADQNPTLNLQHATCNLQLGLNYLQNLDRFDAIIKSPGIPSSVLQPATCNLKQTLITTSTQIFFDTIKDSGAIVIGVTGSKGKSTTASLIHHILKAQSSKLKAQNTLIGNIGEPAIAHLADARPDVIFVMEMSSYQLMDLTVSPHIAVVTAFFPEHLDYHGSLAAYKEAKKHIARFQKPEDYVFFAADSEGARDIASEGSGKKIPFSALNAPVAIAETKLIGTHNVSNIAAAFLVSQQLGIPRETAIKAIRSFMPLPHRLQSLGVRHGIEWVDDSISTTPESAIAALDALGNCVEVIILGGQDRGADFTPLAERLKESSVRTVILMGESGQRIRQALDAAKCQAQTFEVKNMQEAVTIANRSAQSSKLKAQSYPIVLLSPASPSYGMFRNFEERGDQFKIWIEKH